MKKLLIINKNNKKYFHYIILLYNLAISLRIKGSKKLLLNFKKLKK